MTTAWVPLATTTLSGGETSVTFSSIPATYRDLVLVINGSGSAGGSMPVQFNGDSTASNYYNVYGYGYSSGTDYGAPNNNNFLSWDTGECMAIMQIMDYSATDKHKSVLCRMHRGSYSSVWMLAGRWANTNAITSVSFAPSSGTLNSGLTASLYGSNKL